MKCLTIYNILVTILKEPNLKNSKETNMFVYVMCLCKKANIDWYTIIIFLNLNKYILGHQPQISCITQILKVAKSSKVAESPKVAERIHLTLTQNLYVSWCTAECFIKFLQSLIWSLHFVTEWCCRIFSSAIGWFFLKRSGVTVVFCP